MGRPITTRRVLLAMAAPLLAGCGFHPVYGPTTGAASGAAAEGLAEINVGLIPERMGQELRLALQERFERAGIAAARRYDLSVSFGVAPEAISIQQDTSSTYLRLVGTAKYSLTAQDPSRGTLTSGNARSVDGLNIFDQQYFAEDLEIEAVIKRIAEAVADQITLQLALYFRKQADKAVG